MTVVGEIVGEVGAESSGMPPRPSCGGNGERYLLVFEGERQAAGLVNTFKGSVDGCSTWMAVLME